MAEHKVPDSRMKADLMNLEHALNEHGHLRSRWKDFLNDIQNPAIYENKDLAYTYEDDLFTLGLGALKIELRPRFTKEKMKTKDGKDFIDRKLFIDFHMRDIFFTKEGEKRTRYALVHTMEVETIPSKGPLGDTSKFLSVVYGIAEKFL